MRAFPHQAALVLGLAVSCQRGAGSTSNEQPAATTAQAPAPSVVATQQAVTPASSVIAPAADPIEACVPAQRIAPATLAATWPARLGQRVRMKGHVELSVDLMTAVIRAGGQRFAVVVGPDRLWEGDQERTFTVMGSTTVAMGGKVTMPQLLLEDECAP